MPYGIQASSYRGRFGRSIAPNTGDMRTLIQETWANGVRRLANLQKRAQSHLDRVLGGIYVDEIMCRL
jgi:hypothetical protein